MSQAIRGVIAAIATPFSESGEPDLPRLVARAAGLLDGGCDGLNLLGTTGEATSLSVAQRIRVMEAVGASALPLDRMIVGTGAAALQDAALLTRRAAEIGFSAALLLPPFYYKPVSDAGMLRFVEAVSEATAATLIPLYLYNFPALSGVNYTPQLVALLLDRLGSRIAGLKDSSGDVGYATEVAALSPAIAVYPSNEATLFQARMGGPFAGCISATANLNAPDCALAYHRGDPAALERAIRLRGIFDGLPLVPGIKAMIARLENDRGHAPTLPPLAPLDAAQLETLLDRYAALGRQAASETLGARS
ncbi:MAG: 4-hydroxy-tetrahydrodipicolinate synthase [Phenylobacterium sp.]|uniref:dihydrodipicolinate synthase family protein n=1 Tax=Phenylobacterium sp. TaxID=1871053 RepID=UPI0026112330|nr:dihydrodipicolinate synthase family protein [Phenylobacterium sp.]MDB5496980.1 4-hydroxy-tetrahydrodipicolinate synthase [Phenylobacterium sp.]